MPKSTIDWESAETWRRVLASVHATGVKIDLNETAKFFGTTYGSMEKQFRKVKQEAAELQKAYQSGDAGEGTPERAKSTPSTPKTKTPKKDPLHAVANGKIAKQTPSKKPGIKKEPSIDDADRGNGQHVFSNLPGVGEGAAMT